MSEKVRHTKKARRQASPRFAEEDRSEELFKALSEQEVREVNQKSCLIVSGMPLLANHLEDALSQLGISCDE